MKAYLNFTRAMFVILAVILLVLSALGMYSRWVGDESLTTLTLKLMALWLVCVFPSLHMGYLKHRFGIRALGSSYGQSFLRVNLYDVAVMLDTMIMTVVVLMIIGWLRIPGIN